MDRGEHQTAVVGAPADRSDLVERPAELHAAISAHASVRRPQSHRTADDGRADEACRGFGADGKADESGGGCNRGSRRRTRGVLARIPGIAGDAAIPQDRSAGQCVGGQFRHEHRASIFKPLGDGGLHVDDAIAVLPDAPRRGVARVGEDVLEAQGDSVKRSAIMLRPQFLVGALGLFQGQLVHEGHDTFEQRVVAPEPFQIELRQFHRRNLSTAQEVPELPNGTERQLLVGVGPWSRIGDPCFGPRAGDVLIS